MKKNRTKNKFKTKNKSKNKKINIYYFGGGCFWSIEKKFNNIRGILDTKVGYMGGKNKPTYEKVCSGNSGHTEIIKIKTKLSLDKLLKHFLSFHDYTILKKEQYKSVFFYNNNKELKIFQKFIKKYKNIVTEALPKQNFYIAEDYHQMYNFQKPCKNIKTEKKTVFNKICKNNTIKAEKRYSGKYLNNNLSGIYKCSCCHNDLYHSIDKYDSKTGWPSFSKPISENSVLFNKYNSEIRCLNCGLHLGHRTFDGPTISKIHDCINSACLYFKKEKKKSYRKITKLGKEWIRLASEDMKQREKNNI